MLSLAMSISVNMGYTMVPGVIGSVVVAGLIGGVVYCLHRFAQKKQLRKFFAEKKFLCVLIESLLFVVMLAGMIAIRTTVSWDVIDNAVYENAKVTDGKFYAAIDHGGYRVYLYLMNIALLLLGNHTFSAVVLQLLLLVAAAVSIYLGIRKLVNPMAALVVTAFLGFMPYLLTETCSLTPFLVFLLCFGLSLNFIGGIGDSMASCNKILDQIIAVLCYVASGVFIGWCCYLDVTGIALLVILTGEICCGDYMKLRMEEEWETRDEYIRPGSLRAFERRASEILSSPVVVFAGIIIVAFCSYRKIHGDFGSISRQLALYNHGEWLSPMELGAGGEYFEGVILAVLFLFGVFSFWCSKKMGNRVVWFFVVSLLVAMQCSGITAPQYFNGAAVLYIVCAVLAGCGLSDVIAPKAEKVKVSEETDLAIIDMDVQEEPKEENTENLNPESSNEVASEPAINFIENPLPLPKKHTRKVMDYDYEVAEDDDFDIP